MWLVVRIVVWMMVRMVVDGDGEDGGENGDDNGGKEGTHTNPICFNYQIWLSNSIIPTHTDPYQPIPNYTNPY